MCTLILVDRLVPDFPVVVAANRDEFHARPAGPPQRCRPGGGNPEFVAPRDLEAGGTWMGLNSTGLFVGLTNRPTRRVSRDRRSRGLLVLDALAASSSARVAEKIAGDGAALETSYNPFHLLCADGRQTYLTLVDERHANTRALEPGIQVVCTRDESDPSSRKTARIRASVERLDLRAPVDVLLDALAEVLRSHDDANEPLENACVHKGDYGTRSSSLLAVGPGGSRLLYAPGSPCDTKYEDFTSLLDTVQPAI